MLSSETAAVNRAESAFVSPALYRVILCSHLFVSAENFASLQPLVNDSAACCCTSQTRCLLFAVSLSHWPSRSFITGMNLLFSKFITVQIC